MAGAFFNCSKVVVIEENSKKKKGEKKKRKGGKGNGKEGKNIPSGSISAAAGMMIRSVHLGSQCD